MARISKGELKRRARAEREANHQVSRELKQREAMNKMTLGLARSEITDEDRARAAKSTLPKSPVRFVDDETRKIKSVDTRYNGSTKPLPVRYVGEMAEREAAAQKEIAQKKKRVAIMVNKSVYQYISDDADPKTFGRK